MKRYIYLFILMVCFAACADDDSLTPTGTPEFGYSVPQGNHEYDDRIVDWNEKCNVFILYKFNLKELYWQVTSWNESQKNEEGATNPYVRGIVGEIADSNYVEQQLDLVEQQFLNFYHDTTLRRCLPLKLLLCSKLLNRTIQGTETRLNVYSGYDYLALNWGSQEIQTITTTQKNSFKNDVNYAFLTRLLDKGKIIEDADFYENANYEKTVTNKDMYGRGFIKAGTKEDNDIENFIQAIIQNSYEDLLAEQKDGDTSYKGILSAKKDVNGYIRKKYDSLVNKFKNAYGIDLQAIGNATLK